MELHHLRAFVTVAEEGHLTRAAERLCLSQPAVSAHIRSLEEELDVSLFLRGPKGMTLSSAGNALLERARRVLNEATDLLAAAGCLRGSLRGRIALGINTDSAFLRVGAISTRVGREYPDVSLSLVNSSSWEIVRDVGRGNLDCGFVYGRVPDGDVVAYLLARVPMCVVGPAAWSGHLASACWEQLADMPWIWMAEHCPFLEVLETRFASSGLEPKKCRQADHEDILRALAVAGEGLTMMREDEALQGQRNGELCVWPRERLSMDLSLVIRRNKVEDPVLRAVSDVIMSVWEE